MNTDYLSWRAGRHKLAVRPDERGFMLCDATTGEVLAENRTREQILSWLNYLDRKKFERSCQTTHAKPTHTPLQLISLF